MTRIEIDFETKLPPDKVVASLIDFSPSRPDVWPGLARELYEVYSVGETSAEVQEGSTKPVKVWAKERYDWSTPRTVTWTVKESNFCTPGSFVSVRAEPSGSGGSRVHLHWERSPSNARGRVAVTFMKLFGAKVLKNYCTKVLDGLAEKDAMA
jgi:polyketide cyclase/dehydrase/lipid transport protein